VDHDSDIDSPLAELDEAVATSGKEEPEAVGTDDASVVAAADRALDGVARVLVAIDATACECKQGAADAAAKPPPFWETEQCGPPTPTASSERTGDEEDQYSDDDDDDEHDDDATELPVAVVTR
jgi:hypothetical protein